jgi:DNA-binding LacI/PurR family transcriptional regulator
MGVPSEMKSSPTVLGRPADRTNLIVRELRGQIVKGQLTPGSQLPTRAEIEESFSAGATTVQRALEHLRRDGFIQVNGRQGTFVVDNPPHLTNYALVFSSDPSIDNWTRFHAALQNEAQVLQQIRDFNIQIYYNINQHSESSDFRKLVKEVQSHRLGGIIFASNPFLVADTPLLSDTGIARVAIMGDKHDYNWPIVSNDSASFWQRAIQYLASRGRKRLGVLIPSGLQRSMEDHLLSSIGQYSMTIQPHWIQGMTLGAPEFAANIMHLLMHSGQNERPDALIIADDNLVEHAMRGLVAAGVNVPNDVDVVAHCNFPYLTPSVLPVKRLGYDARQVLQACIDNLKNTQQKPLVTRIPALFEEEVEPMRSSQERY